MKVNYFLSVTSRTPYETTLENLVKSIRSSEDLKLKTQQYRALLIDDREQATELKKNCVGFLPAALVDGKRARANVTALTGLVMCDFDHVPTDRLEEVRRLVNKDEHTVLSYVTLSGEGLRVLAAFQPSQQEFNLQQEENYYRKMFAAANEYYAKLTGCEFDPACKDLSRLSFAAYDPDVYYQPSAVPFTITEAPAKRKNSKAERSRLNKAIYRISKTYQTQIVPALKRDGVEYAPGKHNNYVMRVGYLLNKFGFDLSDAQAWGTKEFIDYAEAADVIKSCYEKTDEHGQWADQADRQAGRSRLPYAQRNEIIEFLNEKLEMRRNLVLGATEVRWRQPVYEGIDSPHSHDRRAFTAVTDCLVNTLALLMEREKCLDAPEQRFYSALNSDEIPEFDPFSHYLNSLPEWDAEKDPDYLGELADTVRIIDDDPNAVSLWRSCMKKWLVAMLAGWTDNEVVNHTILIFIGAQGTYKSTWMMNLMPPQLREYFKIKQNSGDLNKDDILAMSRYGLILHEELDAMGTKENNHMKAMTTAKNSSERKAYHREEMRRYNIASLCATGNNERFLSNDQGTRRMLVFRVQVVKPPIENPFNYEGIYSQAYSLLKNGFQYYFSPEEQARLEMHNKQFETVNMEEEMLSLWVRKPEPGETPLWMRTGQLADEIAARSHGHLRFNANKIGPILTARDFVKTKINGYYGYKVILRNYDEVLRHLKEMAINREESISQVSPSVQEQYERLLGERDDRELFNDDEN